MNFKVTQKLGMIGLILALLPLMLPQGLTLSRCNISGEIMVGFADLNATQSIEACVCAPSFGTPRADLGSGQDGQNLELRTCSRCNPGVDSGQPSQPKNQNRFSSPCCTLLMTLNQGTLSDQLGSQVKVDCPVMQVVTLSQSSLQPLNTDHLSPLTPQPLRDRLRSRALDQAFPLPLRV